MRKTLQNQPSITGQDVLYVLVLIAISLLFCLMPAHSFGQTLPENANEIFPTLGSAIDSALPPMPTNAEPAPASFGLNTPGFALQTPDSAHSTPEPVHAFTQTKTLPEVPVPVAAPVSPQTGNQFSTLLPSAPQQQQQQPPLLRTPQRETATTTEHPFRQYWGVPNDPQTQITGKPMTVAELCAGTRSPLVRCQLLQAYWELSGLLAVYHFRCETERQAIGAGGAQQENMLTLLREQRRTAEVEFIKQQWVLAELLKQFKGRTFRASELPIPADFPLYPRYQTHADKIARSERTQYLGRMIPIQEQLIESKNGTWKAASGMAQNASQPFFVLSTQRTAAFLELTKAITDYNKMIAAYATETMSPNVSLQQLVGAVVRVPQHNATEATSQSLAADESLTFSPSGQGYAGQDIRFAHYEVQHGVPSGLMAQPVQQVGYEFVSPPNVVPVEKFDPLIESVMDRFEREPEAAPIPNAFDKAFAEE